MASLLRLSRHASLLQRGAPSSMMMLRAPMAAMNPCSNALPRAFRLATAAAVRPARAAGAALPFSSTALRGPSAAPIRTQLSSASTLPSNGASVAARFSTSSGGSHRSHSDSSSSDSSSGRAHPLLLPALRGARLAAVLVATATGTYWLLSTASEVDVGRALRESMSGSVPRHGSMQLNPREAQYPVSLLVILGLNAAVFVLHRVLPPPIAYTYLYTSVMHLRGGHYVTLLTSVFSHRGGLHLALNCFAIHLFGRLAVSAIGERDFVIFYLLAGVVSSLAALTCARFIGSRSLIARAIQQPALGASGAAFGLVALTAVFHPHLQFSMFLGLVPPMPAEQLTPLLCAFDLAGAIYHWARDSVPSIGHHAHLSGALFGYFWAHTYLRYFNPRAKAFFERQQRLRAMGIKA